MSLVVHENSTESVGGPAAPNNSIDTSSEKKFDFGKVTDLINAGKLADALVTVRAAIKGHADCGLIYKLGQIFLLQNKAHAARVYFELAVRINPQQPKFSIALGDCLFRLGMWEEACKAYAWGISQSSGLRLSVGLRSLAAAFEAAQQPLQAIIAVRKAIDLDPADEKALAMLHRLALTSRRSSQQGSELAAKLLELPNVSAKILYQAATVELQLGDVQIACSLADQAYRRHTDKRFKEIDFTAPEFTDCIRAMLLSGTTIPWSQYAILQREHATHMTPGRVSEFFSCLPIDAHLVEIGKIDDVLPQFRYALNRNNWARDCADTTDPAVLAAVLNKASGSKPLIVAAQGSVAIDLASKQLLSGRHNIRAFIGFFNGEGIGERINALERFHNSHFSLFIDQRYFLAEPVPTTFGLWLSSNHWLGKPIAFRANPFSNIEEFSSNSLESDTFDADTVNKVTKIITNSIESAKPFSLIRIGDGEGWILRYGDDATHEEVDRMFNIWFGRPVASESEIFNLKSYLETAVRTADVLGLHNRKVDECDVISPSREFSLSRECVDRYYLRNKTSVVCHANIHYQLLTCGFFNDLLQNAEFVGVITPRNITDYIKARFKIRFVDWYRVPEEARYKSHASVMQSHFPEKFSKIMDNLRLPFPGALFLVGAGPLGKAYCTRIKELGGVAIDIGSVFDAWGLTGRQSVIKEYIGM